LRSLQEWESRTGILGFFGLELDRAAHPFSQMRKSGTSRSSLNSYAESWTAPDYCKTSHSAPASYFGLMGDAMFIRRFKLQLMAAIWIAVLQTNTSTLAAEQIPVRHVEGVTLGFLVLRDLDGRELAYGELKQVVEEKDHAALVISDLRFEFKDGSSYDEITKFTQRGKFQLLSDQVKQKGPSFKTQSESWIDASTGKVTVRTIDNGKEKATTKRIDLPDDLANGLLFILLKNVDPSAATTVSFLAVSEKPRVVKWNIVPGPQKTIKVGFLERKAQHFVVKTKIEGVAGKIAPIVGKQPPDIHVWMVKSEAPTFLEYEGPLFEDGPIWRIEMAAPARDSHTGKTD
jgi:hypothetical protein